MKAAHSRSLVLVWSVAEIEAKRLGAGELEPAHFLVGLGKAVDIDWVEAVGKDAADRADVLEEMLREMRILREELESFGLGPKQLRRGLREQLGGARGSAGQRRLRRSADARRAFVAAEKMAALTQSQVYPRHLLWAILASASERLMGFLHGAGFQTAPLRRAVGWQSRQPAGPTDKRATLN